MHKCFSGPGIHPPPTDSPIDTVCLCSRRREKGTKNRTVTGQWEDAPKDSTAARIIIIISRKYVLQELLCESPGCLPHTSALHEPCKSPQTPTLSYIAYSVQHRDPFNIVLWLDGITEKSNCISLNLDPTREQLCGRTHHPLSCILGGQSQGKLQLLFILNCRMLALGSMI